MTASLRVMTIMLAASSVTAAPVSAQRSAAPVFGISYVANAPHLMAGVGAYAPLPVLGGLGVYLDAKFDIDSPTGDDIFIGTVTAREVETEVSGAQFMRDEDSWRSFNAALLRPLTPEFMVYVGAGIANRTRYRQYQDPERELSEFGAILVEAPEDERTAVNGLAGAFLRVGRLLDFQFGLETTPRGFTVGASFKLPPR